MPVGHGPLVVAVLGVLLLLWAVGAWRRIRRLRLHACRAFVALDRVLSEQHRWIAQWCAQSHANVGAPLPAASMQRLEASAAQAALMLCRVRGDPLDAAAMSGLHQARLTLRSVWLGAVDPAELPADWLRRLHQEAPLATAFNERVAAYNAAVSQFPALLLATVLRHRKARVLQAVELI